MSDFYRNGPNSNDPFGMAETPEDGRNPWQQQPDPFAPYDDPSVMGMAESPKTDEFAAWRRPPSASTSPFLTEEAAIGAEMQQSGVPLPMAAGDDDFLNQGTDAPTRIATPVVPQQMVSKRKTLDRGERPAFAPPPAMDFGAKEGPAPAMNMFGGEERPDPSAVPSQTEMPEPAEAPQGRQRRAGRLARYHESDAPRGDVSAPEAPAAPRPPATVPLASQAYGAPVVHAMGKTDTAADEPWKSQAVSSGPEDEHMYRPPMHNGFDPFEAGDAEIGGEENRPPRRAAVPGERYTGARTAMPQSGAPIPRSKVGLLPEEDEGPSQEEKAMAARDRVMAQNRRREADAENMQRPPQGAPERLPVQGERPQGQRPPVGPDGRPVRPQGAQAGRPQGQRPPVGPDGRPVRPQGAKTGRPQGQHPPMGPDGRPMRQQERRPGEDPQARRSATAGRQAPQYDDDSERFEPAGRGKADDTGRRRPHASVKRPRYDFEDEEDVPVRRRGCLTPVLILLLVVGGLMAGILLPGWDAQADGISGMLGGMKAGIVGVFENVKNMIFPTEVRLTSFTVNPAEGTAPADLVFYVQTATSVTDLRVVDDQGNVVLQKTLTDEDLLSGTVTKNTKESIWILGYVAQNEYAGNYTVQTMLKDGTWDEGMALAAPVAIAAAPIPQPPVQGFDSDTLQGEVPAQVKFTVDTSDDVVAVRVVDDYGMTVVSHSLTEGSSKAGTVDEAAQGLVWELTADVQEAYEGNYRVEYQTTADLNFNTSEYSTYVELEEAPEPVANADGDESAGENIVLAAANLGDGADDADLTEPGENVMAANAQADPQDTQPEESAQPKAEATPDPTPLPEMKAQAASGASPSDIGLKATIYNELKTTGTFSRTKAVSILDPFNYAVWDQSGVLTFRGGPLRQNAAYGTVDVAEKSLTEAWKVPVGSMKLSKSTVYGIGWPGQAVIVKWPIQVRNLMNLNQEKKNTTALKEVILGAQDGKIYFLDLQDGEATREPINMGAPSTGGASIATNASPILGMGQFYSNLSGKQVDNGYHLYDLLTGKQILLLDGRDKSANSNYSGVTGAALFDKQSKTMVVGGQNGVLYTVEWNDEFDVQGGKLKVSPASQRYKTLATKQTKKETNIDGSVAMYGNYVYYGDEAGIVQCVDINTLTPVWAVKTGDNVDATPALDYDDSKQTMALYTGTTVQNQGKKGTCVIRRLDALTGKTDWEYTVPDIAYTTEFKLGVRSSPVVGQNAIKGLVIFTVTNGKHGSEVIALKKDSGEVAWSQKLESESESSPVAVYSENGDAWLIQAESSGKVHLMNANTGEILNTLQLEGTIEASPAVYRDMIVLGTSGKDTGYIYGIKIQ